MYRYFYCSKYTHLILIWFKKLRPQQSLFSSSIWVEISYLRYQFPLKYGFNLTEQVRSIEEKTFETFESFIPLNNLKLNYDDYGHPLLSILSSV